MVMFTFSFLDKRNPFWVNLVKKKENCQFKLKFGTKTNLKKWNSMMMSTFSAFDHKCLSWANLVKNSKMQNCLFKVKLDTKSNSNMQNSMAVYFTCLD